MRGPGIEFLVLGSRLLAWIRAHTEEYRGEAFQPSNAHPALVAIAHET